MVQRGLFAGRPGVWGFVFLLAWISMLGGCSRCAESGPDTSEGVPRDAPLAAVPDSPAEIDPALREPAPAFKKPDYPPDALPFEESVTRERVEVVRFHEYADHLERERFSSHGYAIVSPSDASALILDPGVGSVRMIRFWAEHRQVAVRGIVVTHGHLDHTGGVALLKETWPDAVFMAPREDAGWMQEQDLLNFGGLRAPLPPNPDRLLDHGDLVKVGDLVLDVIATPGHTKGSICLSLPEEKLLFTGDTLMRRSIGRTNFSHSLTALDLIRSIKTALAPLPDETLVFPGHGWPTRLGEERTENPFLTGGPVEAAKPIDP